MDHTWTLLIILATGEMHAHPASPEICMTYARGAAISGVTPHVDQDGTRIFVRTAVCGPTRALGITPPVGWPDLTQPQIKGALE